MRAVLRARRSCTSLRSFPTQYRCLSTASQPSPAPLKLLHLENFAMTPPKERRFPIGNKGTVGQMLRAAYSESELQWEAATMASPEVLKTVHESNFVDRFLEGANVAAGACILQSDTEREQREISVKWSQELVRRQRAAGAAWRAAQLVLTGEDSNGVVGVVGGGLHHAKRAKPNGWCALNDLAIAVQYGLNEHGVKRAMVVDLDVHQGDGTAEIFRGDERVVTFSMHARKNFPFVKEQSTHDVELEETVSDDEYLKMLRGWLDYLLRIHQPEFIVYQSGVDPLKGDKLGKLNLSRECLRMRTEMLLDMTMSHSPRSKIVITLGGGYQELSVEAHADVFRATADWLKRRHGTAYAASAKCEGSATAALW